jgi:hypothetical protein
MQILWASTWKLQEDTPETIEEDAEQAEHVKLT